MKCYHAVSLQEQQAVNQLSGAVVGFLSKAGNMLELSPSPQAIAAIDR